MPLLFNPRAGRAGSGAAGGAAPLEFHSRLPGYEPTPLMELPALAEELGLPVEKNIGIYAMTEEIVTGTGEILKAFNLPYIPMVHCFLVYAHYRVDLTEGNRNGKNCGIDQFLHTAEVTPNITAKDEYRLYRTALKEHVLVRQEFQGINIKRILQAREKGLERLKANIT